MNDSQFYNIKIASPKEADKKTSTDVTKYVDGCKVTDEDGLIKFLDFTLRNGYLLMDVFSVGMKVDVIGGTLLESKHLFTGQIEELTPNFNDDGSVTLLVRAISDEGGKLGIGIKDLIYPSKNHPKTWATKELMYSDIIIKLAEDSKIKVSSKNIEVVNDIKAGFAKGTVSQKNMTDWYFMQHLAAKIQCTLWTENVNGTPTLFLKNNSIIVDTLARNTFYFVNTDAVAEPFANDAETLQRRAELIQKRNSSAGDYEIQLLTAKVKLDSNKGKGKIKQSIDSETGEVKLTKELVNEEGNTEKWVLDEEKVMKLSSEERTELIELFSSGKVTWEGERGGVAAKEYFKLEIVTSSSRDGEANNTEIEVANGSLKADGVSTENSTKENSGSKSYKTVIDEGKLKNLSSEKKSAIMGRIARGELTEEDKQYYTVVDTTPKQGEG